ncbi:MAG: hypothetical protein IT561_20710 [Alphaproteobacteria bacterium]|nr:hypothetical protein [Alphaproteobacteria bacterium]
MIVYLATAAHDYPMGDFLAGPGAALAGRVRTMHYEEVLTRDPDRLPLGTWIFADLERLGWQGAMLAARLWRRLAERGCRLLNHPTRALRRYEMLRLLHDKGINDFDVYRLTDQRPPRRYPVFLRRDDNHSGPVSALCGDAEALFTAVAGLRRRAWPRQRMIVVEFSDTRGADGLYRKFGAFHVAGSVVAGHMDTSRAWAVKDIDIVDPAETAAELRFLDENPWADAIIDVFRLARLDYGRIDFSVRDGRMIVWEINTNPLIASPASLRPDRAAVAARVFPRLAAALAALDGPSG